MNSTVDHSASESLGDKFGARFRQQCAHFGRYYREQAISVAVVGSSGVQLDPPLPSSQIN